MPCLRINPTKPAFPLAYAPSKKRTFDIRIEDAAPVIGALLELFNMHVIHGFAQSRFMRQKTLPALLPRPLHIPLVPQAYNPEP